ncbi:MAG: anti-sigma factor family protein, partial [Terracidiphilus sp.]
MNEDQKFGRQEGSAHDSLNIPCEDWQPLRALVAAGGELDPAEESRLAAHLAECATCSADLAREKETLALLAAQHAEPDAALLATCRSGLQDALDREEEKGWIARSFGLLLPSSWISPRPAWSAAILLLIGFSVGLFLPRLLLRNAPERGPRTAPSHMQAVRPPLVLAQKSPTSGTDSGSDASNASASTSSASQSGSALSALD